MNAGWYYTCEACGALHDNEFSPTCLDCDRERERERESRDLILKGDEDEDESQ